MSKTNEQTNLDESGKATGTEPGAKAETIIDKVTTPADQIKNPETPAAEAAPANGGEQLVMPGHEAVPATDGAEKIVQLPPPEMVTGDDLLSDQPGQAGEAGETKDTWQCPGCPKCYDYRSLLVRHVIKHHKGDQAILSQVPPQTFKRRNPAQPRQPVSPEAGAETLLQAVASDGPVDYEFMSNVLFDTSTGTLVMIFGDEWKPRNEDERKMMVVGITGYLKAKQIKDIPPGLMLTMLALAYSAPRLRAPSTSEKLRGAWYWVKSIAAKIFKRKAA